MKLLNERVNFVKAKSIVATKNGKTVTQPVESPALRLKWIEAFEKNGWRVKEPKVAA
jgi:hypothetical protein